MHVLITGQKRIVLFLSNARKCHSVSTGSLPLPRLWLFVPRRYAPAVRLSQRLRRAVSTFSKRHDLITEHDREKILFGSFPAKP